MDQGSPASPPTVEKKSEQASGNRTVVLEEVIVTAQKREERLQDVPVPVTAITADALVQSNNLRLQDYYTVIPGLSVTPSDYRGDPMLTIRGVTTGGITTNPTVGIVVDDVPFGSSTGLGGGGVMPDLDPSDLARIEVLRGPQGTLYGASSIGGLVKFVTVDPSTESASGRIQAGFDGVHNGAQLGYNVRGAVNVPLGDSLALRASAFGRRDPGYVDDPVLHESDVNENNVGGARLSAVWKPAQQVSVKLSALLQEIKVYGSSDVEPVVGDLQQVAVRGTGTYDKNIQAYSAIVTAKLGSIDVTSLSGYSINRVSDSIDYSAVFGPLMDAVYGVKGAPFAERNKTSKFTQEIRAASSIGSTVDWLLGLFYTHERTQFATRFLAADPLSGTIVGTLIDSDSFPTTYAEYAAFADVMFHASERLSIQLGARESHNRQTYSESIAGAGDELIFLLPSPVIIPEVATSDNSFTYLVTPSFKVTPDLMVYARLASGYRPGGPNPTSSLFGLPPSFRPDTTQNFELGVKGNVFARWFTFDASLYRINWKDVQIGLVDPTTQAGYFANAGRARSQGAELAVQAQPLQGLSVGAWVAWNDAVLTEAFPPGVAGVSAYGASGDRLPYSSRLSGNLSLDKEFYVGRSMTGFVGGAWSYVGDRKGVFTPSPQRQGFPSYTKTDLHLGVKRTSWTLNAFVTNATDKRGVLSGGLGSPINPLAFQYIQPRTVGLSFSAAF